MDKDEVIIENFRDPDVEAGYYGPETENIVVGDFNPENIEYREFETKARDTIDMLLPGGDSTYIALGEHLYTPQ